MIGLLIAVVVAAIICYVIDVVAVALIGHPTIVGLLCLLLFVGLLLYGWRGGYYNRWGARRGPPV